MERYRRNIQVKEINETGQRKIQETKVLVAGCGGLGSTVLANLAGLGIGHIGIIDNDIIEPSNLNRQFIHKEKNIGKSKVESAREWVIEYNKNVKIETYNIKLDNENYKEIIKNYDIIIDCFDSYESKFLLNDIAITENKILIHGAVSEFQGQVTTIIPHKTACLRCIIPTTDENEYIPTGSISPMVSTIASVQTLEVLKLILPAGEPLTNKLLIYKGLNCEFKKLSFNKEPNCPICSLE